MSNWFDRLKSKLSGKRVERLEPLRNDDEPRHVDKRLLLGLGLLGGASGIALSRGALAQNLNSPSPAGIPSVTSIAAMQALTPTAGAVAYLSLGVQSGNFVWSSANLSTQVTNDPGQGMYVAPASAPTGASGAWVRQFSGEFDGAFWGATGDGVITPATGAINLPTNPASGTTVTLGTQAVTFETGTSNTITGMTGAGPSGAENSPYIIIAAAVAVGLQVQVSGATPSTLNGFYTVIATAAGEVTATSTTAFGTWVSGGTMTVVAANQVILQGTAAATVSALLSFLQQSANAQIVQCNYTLGSPSTTINVQYDLNYVNNLGNGGAYGNSFALATNVTGGSVSAATLTGGGATGTDNSQALANIGVFGRYQATLSGGFKIKFRPGTYLWNGGSCYGWLWNLGNSVFDLAGTTWKNTYASSDGNFAYAWQPYSYTHVGYLINTTMPEGTTASVITPSNSANFHVNEWVLLTSGDALSFGFPPSPNQFEYLQITAIDENGTFTFNLPIRYQHRSDFPDFNASGPTFAIGAARIWKLNTPGTTLTSGGINPPFGTTIPISELNWAVTSKIIGPATFYSGPSAPVYQTWGLLRIETEEWTGPAPSESTCMYSRHRKPVFLTIPELDKQVHEVILEDMILNTGYNCQSPNHNLRIIGGSIFELLTGTTQHVQVENASIGTLSLRTNMSGYGIFTEVKNCEIQNFSTSGVADGWATTITIDGTIVSYANGLITVVTASLSYPYWPTIMPGQQIVFNSTASFFPGDVGVATVLRTYADATHIYVLTDGPVSVPAWCNGTFSPVQIYDVNFAGNTGCDAIRQATEACRAGFPYWARKRLYFSNNSGNANDTFTDASGQLIQILANVTAIGTGTSTVTLSYNTYNNQSPSYTITGISGTASPYTVTATGFVPVANGSTVVISGATPSTLNGTYTITSSSSGSFVATTTATGTWSSGGTATVSQFAEDVIPGLAIVIDGTTLGKRTIGQSSATTTLLGSDSVKVNNGTNLGFLPSNRMLAGGWTWTYLVGSGNAPQIEIIAEYDTGRVRKWVDIEYGTAGELSNAYAKALINLTGLPP